jgi:hypothetical protein
MTAYARKVEIEEYNVRTGNFACVDARNVAKHLFTICLHRKFSVEATQVACEADEPNIGRVVFDYENANLGPRFIRREG